MCVYRFYGKNQTNCRSSLCTLPTSFWHIKKEAADRTGWFIHQFRSLLFSFFRVKKEVNMPNFFNFFIILMASLFIWAQGQGNTIIFIASVIFFAKIFDHPFLLKILYWKLKKIMYLITRTQCQSPVYQRLCWYNWLDSWNWRMYRRLHWCSRRSSSWSPSCSKWWNSCSSSGCSCPCSSTCCRCWEPSGCGKCGYSGRNWRNYYWEQRCCCWWKNSGNY